MPYAQWKKIIYSFMYNFRDHILETGEIVKLDEGLGAFTIRKRKPVKTRMINGEMKIALPVDWKKTKEKGKKIYHFNFETEGYKFKWWWIMRLATFSNISVWTFKASRDSRRLLARYLKTDKKYQNIYCEIDKNIKIEK